MKSNQNSHSLPAKFGAAFLMATSAIDPGSLAQTSQFTVKYLASFAFVILCVVIMDAVAQTNIWSVIDVSGKRGQEIVNAVLPGLGVFLTFLAVLDGLAFSIGNVGGVALGFDVMFDLHKKIGAVLGGALTICIFLSKSSKAAVDKIAQTLGGIIILAMLFIAISSKPPVDEAVVRMFTPERPGSIVGPMLTLLGGFCGGYITFFDAHRLLDAGYGGNKDKVSHFRQSALTGVSVSGTVRVLLFLYVLGACTQGTALVTANVDAIISAKNPAAEAFRLAAGDLGYRLLGLALFPAGVTSVIDAAYTSVSFLETLHPYAREHESQFIVGFIAFSTLVITVLGGAKKMIILAGAVNGLILPISLCCVLLVYRSPKVVDKDYHHPMVLYIIGWVVVIFLVYPTVTALPNLGKLFS